MAKKESFGERASQLVVAFGIAAGSVLTVVTGALTICSLVMERTVGDIGSVFVLSAWATYAFMDSDYFGRESLGGRLGLFAVVATLWGFLDTSAIVHDLATLIVTALAVVGLENTRRLSPKTKNVPAGSMVALEPVHPVPSRFEVDGASASGVSLL